ncbi:MAG TPA: ABC transporter substrate-binding protein [Acidimicrobiia bacterium]|nr:ABC transporter substrate-binding protein [Acidimicrobiia bacterium]
MSGILRRDATRRPAAITAMALLGAVSLVIAGCGSRNNNDKAAAKLPAGASAPAADTGTAPAPSTPDTATPSGAAPATAPDTTASPASSASPATPPGNAPAASTPAAADTKPTAKAASGAATRSAGQASAPGPAGASNPAAGAAPAPGPGAPSPAAPRPGEVPSPAAPTGKKSEIVLGSFGQESGPIGALTVPTIVGAKAWAADANARGGLNGHPVRVIFSDDGGDPNRALNVVRNFVEKDKVLAVYAEHGPVTVAAVMPYLEKVGVPRVGSVEGNAAVDTSPVSFQPTVGADKGTSWSHLLPLHELAPQVKKIHTIYCREVQNCSNFNDHITKDGFAKQLGMEVVGSSQASLAQPDFTAEVLAAKNEGAQAIVVIMENASVVRVARAVKRQGGRILVATQQSMDTESFFKNGGSDVEGVIGGTATAAWATSAKMKDYRDAVDRYQPGGEKGDFGAAAWASGKLLEKAAAGLGDNLTAAALLSGLYGLRNETLGGILPPLTFPRGRSHADVNLCVVVGRAQGGKFVPKDNDPDKFVCAPGWKPETP